MLTLSNFFIGIDQHTMLECFLFFKRDIASNMQNEHLKTVFKVLIIKLELKIDIEQLIN